MVPSSDHLGRQRYKHSRGRFYVTLNNDQIVGGRLRQEANDGVEDADTVLTRGKLYLRKVLSTLQPVAEVG